MVRPVLEVILSLSLSINLLILRRKGYAVPDLRTAYDLNLAAPVIEDTSLNQVLFRCVDTAGTIIGNSYCIVDCAVVGTDTTNDMCTM